MTTLIHEKGLAPAKTFGGGGTKLVSIAEKISLFYGLKTQDTHKTISLTRFRWLYLFCTCSHYSVRSKSLSREKFNVLLLLVSLRQSAHFIDCPFMISRNIKSVSLYRREL